MGTIGVGVATRVLIADDHRLVRDGLRRTITGQGMQVVGEASDGDEAVQMTLELRPDVVLMDVSMPYCDGVEAARLIKEAQPDTPIVMLTMHTDDEVRQDAADVGVNKFLVKDCSAADIVAAISSVAPARNEGASQDSPRLSSREVEVLQHLADGLSVSETAERLSISEKTLRNHLSSTYEKMGVSDRTQALLKAIQLGYVVLPMPT
jgi:two-component system, NarL family, response regulator DegU